MMAKPCKVTPKLERYLLTIARRGSIESIVVALVVIFDGSVVLHEDKLPADMAGPKGIDAALRQIMKRLDVTGPARYVGHFDRGKTHRQYNFMLELAERPSLNPGFTLREAAEAVNVLDRKEAKLIAGSFTRPPAIEQMLVW
ncbi:MAG: hypothetical protein V1861_02250 [Candidatus Micrarchaeota archaeon]